MSALDPHTPVLVGAGQLNGEGAEPTALGLMAEASRRVLADSGAADELLSRMGSVAAIESVSLPVRDPAALLAAELGASPRETVFAITSGSSPAAVLADLATRIQAGELDVALMAGAEAFNPLMKAMREGHAIEHPQQPEGTKPSRVVGVARDATHPAEGNAGLIAPVAVYPFLESAIRSTARRDRETHQRWLGELWERVGAPARDNPHAWTPDVPSAEQIAMPSPENRAVTIPYTKLLNANIQVDQGAALVLCSAQAAQDAGVPRDRWVFVAASAAASDHWYFSERESLDRSPAIAACGRAALGHAGIGIDDVAHLDLYSCFPSAVQIGARELGIDLATDERPPSVTGGLTFAGGPGSNYVTHSLATLAGRVREDPSSYALANGLGWYVTKHALVLLHGEPPARPYAHHDVQDEVDALPGRAVAQDAAGAEVPVEAYTGVYERDGSLRLAAASGLLPDRRRVVAKADHADTLAEVAATDALGRMIRIRDDGRFEFTA